ncbi:MAG TPA: hypothetical protein DDZ51_27955 [Planctomycetaceae bacterium]|nr:hypothetical protein [Planctomycetaceae bacterium]
MSAHFPLPQTFARRAVGFVFVFLGSVCISAAIAQHAIAQINFVPTTQLTSLFPAGASAGTTTDVTIAGEHLDDASRLVFAIPGITSEPKCDQTGKPIPNVFLVTTQGDVAIGKIDLWVQGKFGLSNPRRFFISNLPEVSIVKGGTQQSMAVEVEKNTVVNSTTVANGSAWFKFQGASGSSLFLNLQLPDAFTEPVVRVVDPAGRSILQARSPTRSFPLTVDQDGEYLIEVRDLLFRGGDTFGLRFWVSDQPLDVEPTDSMASAFVDGSEQKRVLAASQAGDDGVPDDLIVNPGEGPPFEHIGRFPLGGKPATFLLNAQANDVYWIDVWSHRLGFPTDASLIIEEVQPSGGGNENAQFVAEAPDIEYSSSARGFELDSRDAIFKFIAPRDGQFRLSLRDIFNTHEGALPHPYRLSIRRASPGFNLVVVPDQGPRNQPNPTTLSVLPATLRRGGVSSLRVFAQRQDDFAGPITITAEGLPPGVQCLGAVVGPGDYCVALPFYASEDAPAWAGLIRVIGKAMVQDEEVIQTAATGTPIWNARDPRQDNFQVRTTQGIGLSVIEELAPVLLEPEIDQVIEAKSNEKISVKLKVTRRHGYEAIFNIRPFVIGNSDKGSVAEQTIQPAIDSVSIELNLASYGLLPGEHCFLFHGHADRYSYRKNFEALEISQTQLNQATDQLAVATKNASQTKEDLDSAKNQLKDLEQSLASTAVDKTATSQANLEAGKAKLAQATQAATEAETALRSAVTVKTDAEKHLATATNVAQPRDVTFAVFSRPIRIRILEK